MAQLTYINTDRPRRQFGGNWTRIADARLRSYSTLLLAAAALWRLPGLALGELQQWDEAIYALRVHAAIQFGALWDQSAHMLTGSYYSAHPPLYVWLSMFWTLLFGDAIWTHRLTSGLAAAALVLIAYRISRRAMPPVLATAAAMFVGFTPLLVRYSRLGQLDILLALCMLAALSAGAEYVRNGRREQLLTGGLLLGAALMTKMLFALTIPAAMLVSAAFLEGDQRRRAVVFAFGAAAVSLPLWLPWLLWFTVQHGQGNPLYIFSSAVPLGATFGGLEGTAKDTGVFYYINQLAIHLSALLPFALFGMYRALRGRRSTVLTVLAVWVLIQLGTLFVARSAFEVYLIPLLGPMVIFGVTGVQSARRSTVAIRRTLLILSAVCLVWSLSLEWRVAMKALMGLGRTAALTSDVLTSAALLLGLTGATVYLAWRCASRRPAIRIFSSSVLWLALIVLAITGFRNFYFVQPAAMHDGAMQSAEFVRASGARYIALIGNGENPQLTWYLRGADIGWGDGVQKYGRLEPHTMGMEAIGDRLREAALSRHSLALIELDEIAHGVYRSPHDVLPKEYTVLLKTPRYVIAGTERRGKEARRDGRGLDRK